MKWFFASVALTLLDPDRLRRRFHFHPIEVQLKTADFFQTFASSNEHSLSLKLRVTRYLKAQMQLKRMHSHGENLYIILTTHRYIQIERKCILKSSRYTLFY